jgi:hypothetical protein
LPAREELIVLVLLIVEAFWLAEIEVAWLSSAGPDVPQMPEKDL